jgi:type IV secretory pathway VirJ component
MAKEIPLTNDTRARGAVIALLGGLLWAFTAGAADEQSPGGTRATDAATRDADAFAYGRFGTVHTYRPKGEPHDVVLFVSGDGGWNLGVVSMAQHLADKGAVVAGIDIRHYLAELEKACHPMWTSKT